MKIENSDLARYREKVLKAPEARCLSITPEGTLRLLGRSDRLINDYLLLVNDRCFAGKGFDRFSSHGIPKEETVIATFTIQKVLLHMGEHWEYISPKHESSESTRFLAIIHIPHGALCLFVSGDSDKTFHASVVDSTTGNFLAANAISVARAWLGEHGSSLQAFLTKEGER